MKVIFIVLALAGASLIHPNPGMCDAFKGCSSEGMSCLKSSACGGHSCACAMPIGRVGPGTCVRAG